MFTTRLLEIKNFDIGSLGILGLIFLCLISYLSSFFFIHDHYFNLVFILLGLGFFLFYLRHIDDFYYEFLKFIFVFVLLIFFILVANHDDFPYYHFPYIILLTEFNHPIE